VKGHCHVCKKLWNQAATDLCPCGEKQTMFHIVNSCPQMNLNGGLSQLHSADDEAVACPHCQLLSSDELKWRLVSATLCWRWSRCLVDQLWLLMHTQEEEEDYERCKKLRYRGGTRTLVNCCTAVQKITFEWPWKWLKVIGIASVR